MASCYTSFPANLPHFFKIILSDNFQDTGLRIPKNFMRQQGRNLSNKVCLHVPGGGLWQVELINTKNGSETWLNKGWRQFADHYSIRYGYFLVFGFEGNSVFRVIIFDHSATEINYPAIETSNNRDFQKGAKSIQTVDHSKRKISPVAYFLRSTKEEIDSLISKSEQGKLNEEIKGCPAKMNEGTKMEVDENTSLEEARVKKVGDNMATEMKTRENDHTSKCMETLRLANAFISMIKNPFFLVTLKPSHLSSRYKLNVPKTFVERIMNKKYKQCILQLSDGRSWRVDRIIYSEGAAVVLRWRKFAHDNSLAVGDVCVFELLSSIHNLLKVSVFQAP